MPPVVSAGSVVGAPLIFSGIDCGGQYSKRLRKARCELRAAVGVAFFEDPGHVGPDAAQCERDIHDAPIPEPGHGEKICAVTLGESRNKDRDPLLGKAFVHTVIAYAEVHDDATALTATAVFFRAVEWFNARGVTVEQVLSDNGGAYRSH